MSVSDFLAIARRNLPAIAQAHLVLATLGGLLLAPPASGKIMLVPLTAAAARALPALALRDDTRLVATGPAPGSLLVEGRRSTFSGFLMHHAILVLAAPPAGCLAGAKG